MKTMLRFRHLAFAAAFACALVGCIIETHSTGSPAGTRIEFGEVRNLGYLCGGPLTQWTVTNRELRTAGTAGCEQPVLFTDLTPGAVYTFDIEGWSGSRLCWTGACAVRATGGTTTFADCSAEIEHLCGF